MIEAGKARPPRGCVLVGWLVELLLTPTLKVPFKPFEPKAKPAPLTTVA